MELTDRWGQELPRLETTRTVLRHPRPADAPALFAIFGDPAVARYWSAPPMRRVAEAEALLRDIDESFHDRELFEWVVARREDDVAVGTLTLFHFQDDDLRAEIGFALGRTAWGQGLMHEVLTTALDFAFGPLGLHRLEADVDPRNERSLRLLERLGFRREGLLRERYHVAGEVQDSVILGLLAPEWTGRTRPPRV